MTLDLDRARTDIAAFSEACGHPLTGFQVNALRLLTRVTVVLAARQSGKSLSAALVGLHRSFANPGHRTLIVSASEEASRRVLSEAKQIATSSRLLRGSVVDEQSQLLTLSNGARIKSVSASERQVRGERVDTLILDEASLLSDELILQAALPTTAARPDAKVLMLGTALVASGAFYDFCQQGLSGSEHISTHKWIPTLLDGDCPMPWLSASALAAARESMSSAAFAAEFLCEFSTGADALVSPKQLAAATADFETFSLADGGRAGLSGGVDWGGGLSRDRSVVVGVGRLLLADRTPRYGVAVAHAWPRDCEPFRVVQDIAASRLPWRTLVPEFNGLGGPLSQDLVRAFRERPKRLGGGRHRRIYLINPYSPKSWDRQTAEQAGRDERPWDEPPLPPVIVRPVSVSAEAKASAFGAIRLLITRGQLLVPESATELRRELLLLKIELTPEGTEKIPTGGRDFASALMLSTGPYRHRGEWKNLLLEMSERAALLPPPTVPHELALSPHVQTGSGLRVPRRPGWMSVAGDETTFPEGLLPEESPPAWLLAVRARRAQLTEEMT